MSVSYDNELKRLGVLAALHGPRFNEVLDVLRELVVAVETDGNIKKAVKNAKKTLERIQKI